MTPQEVIKHAADRGEDVAEVLVLVRTKDGGIHTSWSIQSVESLCMFSKVVDYDIVQQIQKARGG